MIKNEKKDDNHADLFSQTINNRLHYSFFTFAEIKILQIK